ncbi:MAG: R3H domain-containing nucleic acid-binding protein [Pseudomonadota bacterium]
MSDAQNIDDGSPRRPPHDDEPDDNIGNRVRQADENALADDIGNRRRPTDEGPHIDDDIGNRQHRGGGRPGPSQSQSQGPSQGQGPAGGKRRRRRRRRGDGRGDGRVEGRSEAPGAERAPRPARSRDDDDDGPSTNYVLKSDPEVKRASAEDVCRAIVKLCQREATIQAELVEESGQPKVVVLVSEQGSDAPLFTRNSAALSALNFLTNKVVNRFPDDRIRLVVHVQHAAGVGSSAGGPRSATLAGPEEEALRSMALKLADHAVKANRVLSLAPMKSDARRIVHVTLETHPDVVTMSEGEGGARKLLVVPRAKLPEAAPVEPVAPVAPDTQEPS